MKKLNLPIIVLAGALTLPTIACAENWIELSEGSQSIFFDKDSIKSRYDYDGNLIVSMWVLTPLDQPMMHSNGAGTMMLQSANCTDRSIKIAEMTEVDSDGNVLWRLSQDPRRNEIADFMPLDYYYPTPDDNYSNNLDALCHPSTIKLGFNNAKLL